MSQVLRNFPAHFAKDMPQLLKTALSIRSFQIAAYASLGIWAHGQVFSSNNGLGLTWFAVWCCAEIVSRVSTPAAKASTGVSRSPVFP